MNQDAEHLRLLSIFHYVVAGIGFLVASVPLIHVTVGIWMLANPQTFGAGATAGPGRFVGLMFVLMGGFFVLSGWTVAACTVVSGRFLARRKHWLFSMAMGGVLCAFVPFGTVLGVFTIIVLSRESVKALYAATPARKGGDGQGIAPVAQGTGDGR